jgi:hypothetical protein
MDVLGGERLHQAADSEVGHGEARRLAADEQAGDAEGVQMDRDRETGRAVGEVQVEEDEVGVVFLGRGDRAFGIVGGRDHAVARIVLDQIFERRRQLEIVFDHKDSKHPRASPARTEENLPRKSET